MTARRSLALVALLALAFLGVMVPQAGAAVTATFAGGTLTATSDGADPIAVVCDGGAVEVNGAAPVPATGCGAVQSLVVNGGPGANAINLSAVTTAAFPALTSSVVTGGGDADTITGSQIGDRVTPNTGGDTVNAGDGNDTMVWNNGDGSDVMNGEAGADTVEVNGAAAGDVFTVNPNGQRVRFDRTNLVPFSLDIGTTENLVLNGGGGDDTMTGAAGLAGLIVTTMNGQDGNDTLTGTDGADSQSGGAGNDRLVGFRGNDTMAGGDNDDVLVWNNGDGSDVMNGDAGADTVEVNGAAVGDVFTVNPNGQRVRFDRTNLVPFSLDIGTTENLVLNGGGGDDTMTGAAGLAGLIVTTMNGQDGNDTLTGTDGADSQSGGAGNDRLVGFRGNDTMAGGDNDDVLVWNNGDGSDVMNGDAGADTVEVNGAAVGDVFTVNPNGQRVRFDRTNLVPFRLDIGTTESLVLNGGGGDDTMTGATGLARLIVTTMNGQDGNDTLTGTDGRDVVNGGPGDDQIRTRNAPPSVDDVDCGAGEDFARVDPRDRVTGCERVVGGRARVRLIGERARVVGGRARLRLRCTIERRCAGTVELRRGSQVLGRARFSATNRRLRVVPVRLSLRTRRLVANARARGLAVTVQINARDAAGNGWRTTARIRLRR